MITPKQACKANNWERSRFTGIGLTFIFLISPMLTACQQTADTVTSTVDLEQPGATQAVGGEDSASVTEQLPSEVDPRRTWQSGPHADTFVITDSGMNSSCARCHAPVNFVPTMEDIPESCLTCKFEIDPPPPLIPEEEWIHIECIVCHRVDKDEVDPAFAWLAIVPIEEYEEVSSASELCLKCHAGDSVSDHFSIALAGAHQAMLCTDCHDAHNGNASCADSACHVGAATPAAGHDPEHENVACVACHDSGELEVAPRPEDELWSTWTVLETGELSRPFSSHNTVLSAPCARCHFPNNPWSLSDAVQNEAP